MGGACLEKGVVNGTWAYSMGAWSKGRGLTERGGAALSRQKHS